MPDTAFAFADPPGDAHGNGGYVLPSRPAVQADALDLREFQVQGTPLTFRVSYGSLQNPWNLPSGFSAAVTDIFVRTGTEGVKELPDLGLNVAGGWTYHVRVTGAGATLQQATLQEGTAKLTTLAVPQVTHEGTTLVIATQIPAGQYAYWVTSSVYTPLSPRGVLASSLQAGPGNLQITSPGDPAATDVLAPAEDRSAYSTHTLNSVGQVQDWRPLTLGATGVLGLLLTVLATWWLRRSPEPKVPSSR